MRTWRRVLAAAGLCVGVLTATSAGAETRRFTGEARDLKTGKVVYTETYEVEVEQGKWKSGVTRYFLPGGAPLGERKFDFSKDPYVPLFTFDQSDVDYHEGITKIEAKNLDLFHVKDGEKSAGTIPRVAKMVADCGSQPFLVDHLEPLARGETVPFVLAVAGRTDSFKLRVRKIEDTHFDGIPALRLRIELDSVLRLVLPNLELVFDPASKRLLEYSGISNVKDPSTRKAYSVRIKFAYP